MVQAEAHKTNLPSQQTVWVVNYKLSKETIARASLQRAEHYSWLAAAQQLSLTVMSAPPNGSVR